MHDQESSPGGGGAPRCPECGHEIAMHRTGVSPQYAGCLVREPLGTPKPRWCRCELTPAALTERLREGAPK